MLASFQRHYSLSYSTVSFIFLVNVAGWLIATPSAPFLLYHIGARTTLILALLLHVFSQLTMTFAPPFWAIVISLLLIGTGSGMIDATVSTYVARLGSEKTVSVLYAFFSVGGLLSPLVVGCILGGNAKWSNYYFVPVGMAALSLIPVWYLFDGYVEPKEEQETTDGDSISIGERYLRALLSRVVIIGGLLATLVGALGYWCFVSIILTNYDRA
jgi:predicted MFS family arabinose efflux permease